MFSDKVTSLIKDYYVVQLFIKLVEKNCEQLTNLPFRDSPN